MTSSGSYFIASVLDFSGRDPAICRTMQKAVTVPRPVRTAQHNPKWLNEPNFVASYEINNFTYFFFRENAVENMNCGKTVLSRVARVCQNDQGGQYMLKDTWTTFLKARLNCSIPGEYPFYYNEIQGVHFLEQEQILYATFTTPTNSIAGSAICAFNMTAITKAFTGAFKYQSSSNHAWERQTSTSKHFQCDSPVPSHRLLESEKYQLMDDAVQPSISNVLFKEDMNRYTHITVDVIATKLHEGVHIMFVALSTGIVKKLAVLPRTKEICLIEEIAIFSEATHSGSQRIIRSMKFLKETGSLYIGTDYSVLRVPVQRCHRYKTKSACLNAQDPYCGWNTHTLTCTVAPQRNPLNNAWHQTITSCPVLNEPVDGDWSDWSQWKTCSHTGENISGNECQCRTRKCDSPKPQNGGKHCDGLNQEVSNCTRDGQWTDWSPWSSCSQTCGLAVKSRRRSCSNPSPAFGGSECEGSDREEIYCTFNPPCPAPLQTPTDGKWSGWSAWDECSTLCGGGIQTRRRRCDNPPPTNGGRDCQGCHIEYKSCNTQVCPESRKSTTWTPWLRANQTKEGYVEIRYRFTCKAHVADSQLVKVGQMKSEERYCLADGSGCLHSAFMNTDGDWSEWSQWSECSSTCGGGMQYRERRCDSPKPQGSGQDCQGKHREERICGTDQCPEDVWTEWSSWSNCTLQGYQFRVRKCVSETCDGPEADSRTCHPNTLSNQVDASTSYSESEGGATTVTLSQAVVIGVISFVVGALISGLVVYNYASKRRLSMLNNKSVVYSHKSEAKPNPYVTITEWNNFSTIQRSKNSNGNKEATIKRNKNGHVRANLDSGISFE